MIRLVVREGPWAGREIVTASERILIGTDDSRCGLSFGDSSLADLHCILRTGDTGTFVIETAGKAVDLFVNGVQLNVARGQTSARLTSQDRFRIGNTEVEVQLCTARLRIVAGQRSGREIVLGEELVSLGRAPDNSIDFEDPDVSVYHAVLRCTPAGFVVEDQNSTNGTWVQGTRVSSHVLSDGDTVHIGRTELRFLVESENGDAESEYDWGARPTRGDSGPVLARIAFLAGSREGDEFELIEEQAMFGRRPSCFVTMSDLRISGTHFGITRIDNQYHITDLQSANGTLLNNSRLSATTLLTNGDLITFGDSVAEFRVAGGVAPIDGGATLLGELVMADGAYTVASNPKFVVAGSVESTTELHIGASPQCSLFVEDDARVEAVHARVVYDKGFFIEDKSKSGTYVNDRRVVRDELLSGQVIRVGQTLIDVSIRGERCTLDVIDKAMARAAVQVARETSFDLGQAKVDPAEKGNAYKTMFSMQVADVDALVRERKESFQQGAPAWRPSSDLSKNTLARSMVAVAAVASLALLAFVFIQDRQNSLVNHPLSEAHASKRFVNMAHDKGLPNDCRACHQTDVKGQDFNCVTCHEGFDKGRPAHLASASAAPTPVANHSPGSECVSCHNEHEGMKRAEPGQPQNHLGAKESCTAAGCHKDQHADDNFSSDVHLINAPKLGANSLSQEELHIVHAELPKDSRGRELGCRSCHGMVDSEGNFTSEEAEAGRSCFRCHSAPSAELINQQCLSCHEQEHATANLARLPAGDPLLEPAGAPPSTKRSTALAVGYLAILVTPLFLVAGFRLGRRRKEDETMVSRLNEYPVETVKRLVHSINVDKCVGCRMCVQACPASVLELVNHKSTVVNFDACIQCKRCEAACAFDALRMHDADKPPPSIKMPDVDAWYQTSVKGMYLIGQAAGTPQVKNASNVGTAVVHHAVAHGLQPGMSARVGAQFDVLICGSGPAGLSAALACHEKGLSYLVLEKQRDFSWTIRNYYHKGKPVMAEPNQVEMAGLLHHWDTNREDLLNHWKKQVEEIQMPIEFQKDVTNVEKKGELFVVSCSQGKDVPEKNYTAARVILAIGTMGNPRKLGCPGEDLEKVRNSLVDPGEFQGRNVLIVGGTDSAIEVVMALKDTNKVWLSCRSAKFDRVKPKNLELITEAIESGQVTALWSTQVKEVGESSATVESRTNKECTTVPNDVVFAMIGGHPPVKFLESIGVPYIERPHSWSPPRSDELVQSAKAL